MRDVHVHRATAVHGSEPRLGLHRRALEHLRLDHPDVFAQKQLPRQPDHPRRLYPDLVVAPRDNSRDLPDRCEQNCIFRVCATLKQLVTDHFDIRNDGFRGTVN